LLHANHAIQLAYRVAAQELARALSIQQYSQSEN